MTDYKHNHAKALPACLPVGRDRRRPCPSGRRGGQEKLQRKKSGSISLNCLNGSNGKKTDK
ncbi:MAG: hypothetical protein ACUZ8N_00765 [Candidatus Scalindua sp.]